MEMFWNALTIILIVKSILAAAPKEVIFLIRSHDTSYHNQLSSYLQKDIIQQAHSVPSDYVIKVKLLHEVYPHPGYWTILPAFAYIIGSSELVNEDTKWIIICDDSTQIRLPLLLDKLNRENHTEEEFYLGHTIYDQVATIIHHFAFFENPNWFPYPMLQAGIIFTPALFKRIAEVVTKNKRTRPTHTEFTIDAAHEIALHIFDDMSIDSSNGLSEVLEEPKRESDHRTKTIEGKVGSLNMARNIFLRRTPYICPWSAGAQPNETICAMYAKPKDISHCLPFKREQVYFAIKTCQKYHKKRIPIIEATWARLAVHRRYFSDVADASIPTVSSGVPNTETGHCAKTLAILRLSLSEIEGMNDHLNQDHRIHWIFLADDDTLLSVSGLCEILGCFSPLEEVYLGERYGFRLYAEDGFNYITGGGGIALSLPVVRLILLHCTCPSPSAPDDMIVGSCLHSLRVNAIHSSRFHQARPSDYSSVLLNVEPPISFHTFWQMDPIAVYERWFAAADRRMLHLEALQMHKQLKTQPPSNESQCSSKLSTYDVPRSVGYKYLPRVSAEGRSTTKRNYFPLAHELDHLNSKHVEL